MFHCFPSWIPPIRVMQSGGKYNPKRGVNEGEVTNMKRFKTGTKVKLVSCLVVLATFLVLLLVQAAPTTASVYDYGINWAVQTGATEVTVEVQANYCYACNPNDAGNPGDPEFAHGYPPPSYPYNYYGGECGADGRYMAVRVTDSGGNVLGTQKLVLDQTNWPIGSVQSAQFIFAGLTVAAGDLVIIEADTYCSWCGHWYPQPIGLAVEGSNSGITYTGDTQGMVGTNADVSAVLIDAGTGLPLVGETITFTLDGLPPVSAVTDASGTAATTLPIPSDMITGTYDITARFAGSADYFPCSDTDPFLVEDIIQVSIDIKPGSWPNSINLGQFGVTPVAVLTTSSFDAATVDGSTVRFGPNQVLALRWALEDVDADGDTDMILHFSTRALGLTASSTEATLTGQTLGGGEIQGTDAVRIVPPKR